MSDYSLLTSILPLLSQYEQENKSASPTTIEGFASWIHEEMILRKQYTDKRLPPEIISDMPRGEDLPVTLGKMVYYMYRYARFYTKKALKDSMLNSLDEFTFLVTLLHLPSITKTELINKMVYDKTSGIELINRLIKQGLVNEHENPADKRSKIIAITDAGRGVLFSSFEELGKVSRIIPGNLSGDELTTLIRLLDKLDHHHSNIWEHHRDSDLDKIISSATE